VFALFRHAFAPFRQPRWSGRAWFWLATHHLSYRVLAACRTDIT
jgi:hypothetical protein